LHEIDEIQKRRKSPKRRILQNLKGNGGKIGKQDEKHEEPKWWKYAKRRISEQ
jgi:hypothetical protein